MTYYGFNFTWMFSWSLGRAPEPVDERALDFLAATGFNFVRLPMDYRYWTKGFDYLSPDEAVLRAIDSYIGACRQRALHVSLNLHRAPGYCINDNDLERDNLWTDPIAQDAFVFLWEMFARRYLSFPASELSFDLLNEPPSVGEFQLSRDNHAGLMRRTVAAIRAIDPKRPVTIDGLGGGNIAMPELADLEAAQSGRGYQPMPVSHHAAPWWDKRTAPAPPAYPGLDWDGRVWNRETLRDYYAPWREVEAAGVRVHIGECGCFNRTPNEVALRWLGDLFGLYKEFGWGFAMWNFIGPFGIVDHGRPGAVFERMHGFSVDRSLLELMLASRVR